MAQNWRLAKSLATLRDEIRSVHPGTTVWTIGDQSHASGYSDHNPNSAGVVCAIDVLGDKGLNIGQFADHLRQANHRAVKYVIFNRRIWSKARASEGWRRYSGSNPHTTHVHVSVGVGPDGRSTGPYDDTSPWGVANSGGGSLPTTGGDDMSLIGLRKGDDGERVKGLQARLRYAGFSPGDVDGNYGPKTAAAVLKMRKAMGSSADDGDEITGWADAQLEKAMAVAHGGGDVSAKAIVDAVAAYLRTHPPKDGEDGKTPTKITLQLTGDVVAVE